MKDQKQDVSAQGVAIQSGRDTNITQGVTAAQMMEIMAAISAQLPAYAAVAREIVEVRLAAFEKKVVERFASDAAAKPEAFSDPDFQFVLGQAQKAAVRTGDDGLRDTLIDLISRRSAEDRRTRLSLSLNQAIERAALLTEEEFAELSLVYLLRYTINYGVSSVETLSTYLNTHIAPFVNASSEHHTSYTYLQAQGCATIEMGTASIMDIMRHAYPGVICTGFTGEQLVERVGKASATTLMDNKIVAPCINDPTKLQVLASRKEVFLSQASSMLDEDKIVSLWNLMEAATMGRDQLMDVLRPSVPTVDRLFKLWDDSPLSNLSLTPVGLAIGHSNVSRVVKAFDGKLATWIV